MLGIPHIERLTQLTSDRPFLVAFVPVPGRLALVDPLPSVPFDYFPQWGIHVSWFDSFAVAEFSCRSRIGNQWRTYIDFAYPCHLPGLLVDRFPPSRAYLDYRRHVRQAYRSAGIRLPSYPGE